jgi:adenylate cyclase class IV
MNNYTELEYKYSASEVTLTDFISLMNKIGYKKRLDISSWDEYYTNAGEFARFRDSDTPELTIKRKTAATNSWERVEVDLPIDKSRLDATTVPKFMELAGYKPSFTIYKSCFVFWQEDVNYCYYIVYDNNMVEQDRYIEVEVTKSRIEDIGESVARERLAEAELCLTSLGISYKNRFKRSLFEIYGSKQ